MEPGSIAGAALMVVVALFFGREQGLKQGRKHMDLLEAELEEWKRTARSRRKRIQELEEAGRDIAYMVEVTYDEGEPEPDPRDLAAVRRFHHAITQETP